MLAITCSFYVFYTKLKKMQKKQKSVDKRLNVWYIINCQPEKGAAKEYNVLWKLSKTSILSSTVLNLSKLISWKKDIYFFGEFDPGSGWTLAACLRHASRTRRPFEVECLHKADLDFRLVAKGWVTRG